MLTFNIKGHVFEWNGTKDRDALQQFLDQYALVPCTIDSIGESAGIRGGDLGSLASGFSVSSSQINPGAYVAIIGPSVVVLSKQQVSSLMAP